MNTPQPTIVILGAGRIGRGFVADLFAAAGYRLVLVDQSAELVSALRAAGRYTVVCAENAERRHDHVITSYEAYTTGQRAEITRTVAAADLLAVAVFPDAFGSVAQSLLPGLAQRRQERPDAALDILLCANLSHAAPHFRAALDAAPLTAAAAQTAAAEEMQAYLDTRVGLVETLVMRMVADPPAAEREREPLLVWTNGLAQFPVDGRAFRGPLPGLPGPLPDVPGLRLVNDMRAEEMAQAGYIPKTRCLSVSRFNRQLHRYGDFLELCLETLLELSQTGEAFIIDSIPVPVCKRSRARRCRKVRGREFCGYCAAKKEKFFGWRLHLICTPAGQPVALRALARRLS